MSAGPSRTLTLRGRGRCLTGIQIRYPPVKFNCWPHRAPLAANCDRDRGDYTGPDQGRALERFGDGSKKPAAVSPGRA